MGLMVKLEISLCCPDACHCSVTSINQLVSLWGKHKTKADISQLLNSLTSDSMQLLTNSDAFLKLWLVCIQMKRLYNSLCLPVASTMLTVQENVRRGSCLAVMCCVVERLKVELPFASIHPAQNSVDDNKQMHNGRHFASLSKFPPVCFYMSVI